MRNPRALTISVVLAITAAVLLLGPSLLGLRVFHGTDILQRHAPWMETPPDGISVTNPLVGDTVDALIPNIADLRGRIHSGDLPMWSGYSHGGTPFAPMAHSGLFSPFNIPFWVLPLDYAPGVVKLLELAAAIGFTFLFLRRQGLGRQAAALGGLIYAYSGFQVAWTNWSHPHVAALIPALLWAIDRTIEHRSIASSLPVAGVLAVMWTIGFPAVTGYALALGAVFAACKLAGKRGRERLGAGWRTLLGVVLGTGLAAFLLMPFIQWLANVNLAARQQDPGATLARRTLATLAVPNAFGSPVTGNYYGPADYFIYGPVNWVENQAFIGIMALCLIAVAAVYGTRIVSRATLVFLWAGVGACLTLIYVGGPVLSLAQALPIFGSSHVGRLRSVFLFLLAVLAAVGFEVLVRRQRSEPIGRSVRVVVPLAVIALIVGSGLAKAHEMAAETGNQAFFWGQVTLAAVVALVSLALLAASRTKRAHLVALVAIPIVIAFEAMTFAGPWWPQIEHDAFYPTTDAHLFLQERLGHDRMVVAGMTMLPSTNALYGLRSVTAHSFPTIEWADLLRAADPDAFRLSPTFSSIAHEPELMASPALDRMAARYVVTDPRQRVFGERRRLGPSVGEVTVAGGWRQEIDFEEDLQAISVELVEGFAFTPEGGSAVFSLELLDREGEIVGRSRRRLSTSFNPGLREIAVTRPSSAATTIVIRYESGPPLRLAALENGSAVVAVVRAAEHSLPVVFAGGAVIYERPDALSRIRWASRQEVIGDPADRIAALAGPTPHDTVILSAGTDAPGAGGPASLGLVEVEHDRIVVSIESEGWGHLVVMDSLIGMWRATLNGEPASLVEADHAGAAVMVPPGNHTLVLETDIPGWRSGLAITAISALGALMIASTGRRTSPAKLNAGHERQPGEE